MTLHNTAKELMGFQDRFERRRLKVVTEIDKVRKKLPENSKFRALLDGWRNKYAEEIKESHRQIFLKFNELADRTNRIGEGGSETTAISVYSQIDKEIGDITENLRVATRSIKEDAHIAEADIQPEVKEFEKTLKHLSKSRSKSDLTVTELCTIIRSSVSTEQVLKNIQGKSIQIEGINLKINHYNDKFQYPSINFEHFDESKWIRIDVEHNKFIEEDLQFLSSILRERKAALKGIPAKYFEHYLLKIIKAGGHLDGWNAQLKGKNIITDSGQVTIKELIHSIEGMPYWVLLEETGEHILWKVDAESMKNACSYAKYIKSLNEFIKQEQPTQITSIQELISRRRKDNTKIDLKSIDVISSRFGMKKEDAELAKILGESTKWR